MNTTSLLLNGRPGATWAIPVPKSPHSTLKTDARPSTPPSPTTTPTSSPSSSPRLRPRHLRRVSSNSTGWYLDADTPSLQDFERRAQTFAKRLEKFISRCATNVVMGLLNPAAVALILFNPALLVILLMVFIGWVWR